MCLNIVPGLIYLLLLLHAKWAIGEYKNATSIPGIKQHSVGDMLNS